MNVKLRVLSAGVLFFIGQSVIAQKKKPDTLQPKTADIEVVVITGSYGVKQTAEQVTGSSTIVKGDVFDKPSGVSLDNSLQGQVAGLMSTASSGQPGASSITLIRGINSLTGNNDPLYVLDGVPIPSGDIAGLLTSQNALSLLNPADVESVEVLKDGVATSIYGSRGANGVIVITTKKGRKGRSSINFNSEMGTADVAYDKFKMLNAEEHVLLYGTALFNAGVTPTLAAGMSTAASPALLNWNGVANTDWYKEVRRETPVFQRYNLSYSGGVGDLSIYSSLAYMEQEGFALNSEFKRYNALFKGNWKASDKLSLSASINLTQTVNDGPSDASAFSNPVFTGRLLSPTQSIYNANGSYNLNLSYLNPSFNPIAIMEANQEHGEFSKILSTFGMDYDITENLRFNSVFGLDRTLNNEYIFWNPDFGDGVNAGDPNGNGNLYISNGKRTTWNWYNFLHYNKTFGEKHAVSLSAGMEATRKEYFTENFDVQGTESGSRKPFLSSFLNQTGASNGIAKSGLVGYIGRASYTYDKFVTLTGTFRRDGYSGFTDYYGNFFGAGIAVDLGKTGLMPNALKSLKVRASYGENGNTSISSTAKFATYSTLGNYLGSNAGGISNPGLGGTDGIFWETSKKTNAGIDFNFKGKFNIFGSLDYYNNNNTGQIIAVPVPPSSGISSLSKNQATSYSKGFEGTLGLDLANGESFNWTTKFNYAFNESRVTDLSGDPNPTLIDGTKAFFPGHDPSEWYTRLWAGVNASNGQPMWWTDATRTVLTNNSNEATLSFTGKKALPTHIASWSNEMSYKGFKLSFLVNYQGDYSVYDRWAFIYDSDGVYANLNQLSASLYDSWTPTNTDATRPQLINGGNRNSNANSTRYLYDADHIRLKTVELGYRFTKDKLNVKGLNGIYVYIRGTNLYTYAFDKDLYFDPESNSNAFSYTASNLGVYDQTQPNLRQYMMGFSIDF